MVSGLRPGHHHLGMDSSLIDIHHESPPSPSQTPFFNYPAFEALLHFCNHFLIPVIIITGIVGNIFSCLVFVFSPLKRLSTSVYLAALALADCGFLVSLGAGWLDNFRFSFFQQELVCTCVVYVTYIFSFLSVWFVVCFTTDMYLTLFHEDMAAKISQPSKARFVVCGLTLLSGALYLHTFWTTKQVQTIDGWKTCAFVADEKIRMALALTDSLLTLILPFTLLIFMNIRILLVIVGFSKRRLGEEEVSKEKQAVGNENLEALERSKEGHHQERNDGENGGLDKGKKVDASTQETALESLQTDVDSLVSATGKRKTSEEWNSIRRSSSKVNSKSAPGRTRGSCKSSSRKKDGAGEKPQDGGHRLSEKPRTTGLDMEELGSNYDFDLDEFDIDFLSKKRKTMQGKISEMQRKSFKMLLTVAMVFLILNLPSHAIRLQGLLRSLITPNYATSNEEHLCQQLFQVLYYFNFMVNFVIYNVCAKSFRTAFFTLLLILCKASTCSGKKCPMKSKHVLTSRRLGQELRRMREEQNSRLVEVNLAELHISKMESFASDFKYESPPCLLKVSHTAEEAKA